MWTDMWHSVNVTQLQHRCENPPLTSLWWFFNCIWHYMVWRIFLIVNACYKTHAQHLHSLEGYVDVVCGLCSLCGVLCGVGECVGTLSCLCFGQAVPVTRCLSLTIECSYTVCRCQHVCIPGLSSHSFTVFWLCVCVYQRLPGLHVHIRSTAIKVCAAWELWCQSMEP